MSMPRERILSENRHSVDLYNGNAAGLPRLTLHTVSTLSVQVHHGEFPSKLARDSTKTFGEDFAVLNNDTDGLFPEDPHCTPRTMSKTRATPSSIDNPFGSDELDRRLQSIDETLYQQNGKNERRQRRLYTSEVSRIEDFQNLYSDRKEYQVQAEELDSINAWCVSQYADRSEWPNTACASDPSGERCCQLSLESKVFTFHLSISFAPGCTRRCSDLS